MIALSASSVVLYPYEPSWSESEHGELVEGWSLVDVPMLCTVYPVSATRSQGESGQDVSERYEVYANPSSEPRLEPGFRLGDAEGPRFRVLDMEYAPGRLKASVERLRDRLDEDGDGDEPEDGEDDGRRRLLRRVRPHPPGQDPGPPPRP